MSVALYYSSLQNFTGDKGAPCWRNSSNHTKPKTVRQSFVRIVRCELSHDGIKTSTYSCCINPHVVHLSIFSCRDLKPSTRGWEGTVAMNSAINGSEPLDLQDLTPNPAGEPRTLQRSCKPRSGAANPAVRGSEPSKRANYLV